MSRPQVPPGVPALLTLRAAAAALSFPHERVLRDWCRRGTINGFRAARNERWRIPAAEVARLAHVWLTTPDWAAALEVDA